MSKEKYIIRYKLFDNTWCYFARFGLNSDEKEITYSIYNPDSKEIMKMTLEVAEEYVERIEKINSETIRSEIQILDIETNKIIDSEQIKADKEFLNREPVSIFELMDFEE